MTCTHLRKLYELCANEEIKLAGSDLVRIVCTQCGEQEVCPSVLMEEYESDHPGQDDDAPADENE